MARAARASTGPATLAAERAGHAAQAGPWASGTVRPCPSRPPTPRPTGGDPIEPGQPAPAFALPDQHGNHHRLADAGGPVVLFFYPEDDTPGCTREACGFQAAEAQLEEAGALVYGVSPQNVASKKSFADKHGLGFPLLADEGAEVCAAYGVWQEKSMYGRKYPGVARTTYLIDADGVVQKRWDKVKVAGHVEEVLATLQP